MAKLKIRRRTNAMGIMNVSFRAIHYKTLKILFLTFYCLAVTTLLAFCLSAVIRAVLAININFAIILALPPSLVIAYLFMRLSQHSSRKLAFLSPWSMVVVMGLGFSIYRLFNFGFDGFPAYNCSDGANHLVYRDLFIRENPAMVNGIISLYGLSYWLEHLFSLSAYHSFIVAFYLLLVGIFLAFYYLNIAFNFSILSKSVRLHSAGISAITLCAILEYLLLPIISYNQIEGFWAHLFALLPLFWIWVIYSISEHPWQRLLVFLVGAIAYRYTYVLNLGDYFLLGTVLSIWEGRGLNSKRKRFFALIIAAMFTLCAVACYLKLEEIFGLIGSIQQNNLKFVSYALLLFSAVVITWSVIFTKFANKIECGYLGEFAKIQRLLLFPAFFSLISVIALFCYRLFCQCGNYYPYKYLFHPLVLLSFDFVFLIFLLILVIGKQTASKIKCYLVVSTLLTFFVAVGCVYTLRNSYRASLPQYAERTKNLPTYRHLKTLTDTQGEKIIRTILAKNGKAFGGYYLDHWPRYSFVNASLGLPRSHNDYLKAGFIEKPGFCIFWSSPPRNKILKSHYALRAIFKLKRLEENKDFEVVDYMILEGRPKPRKIAYRCY